MRMSARSLKKHLWTYGRAQVVAIEEAFHRAAEPYLTGNLRAPLISLTPAATPRDVVTEGPEGPLGGQSNLSMKGMSQISPLRETPDIFRPPYSLGMGEPSAEVVMTSRESKDVRLKAIMTWELEVRSDAQ